MTQTRVVFNHTAPSSVQWSGLTGWPPL